MAGRAVIDASVSLSLFLLLPYTQQAYRLMEQLAEQQDDLYVPTL